MEFNRNLPRVIHLDINSCFATIEQQANPLLRDKAVVVAAYDGPNGCILASSVTAKKLGIKTGMRILDAQKIYPKVIVLLPDPYKYRFVHKKIKRILKNYSCRVIPKSIDEFVFKSLVASSAQHVACEIKERIKKEIGEYITVSIGISTNSYLAKIASNFKKPDGLTQIDSSNYLEVFSKLELVDLTGIKKGNSTRLKACGINTVLDFYNASIWKLKIAFGGIPGFYWHQRMHGYEIDLPAGRQVILNQPKTVGNSYAPPLRLSNQFFPIVAKLCDKTAFRLRKAELKAKGVHIFLQGRNGKTWHMGRKTKKEIISNRDLFLEIKELFKLSPIKNEFRNIAISTFALEKNNFFQTNIFEDIDKKRRLTNAIDEINSRWGLFTIYTGVTCTDSKVVQDRISFGQP